MLNQLRIQRDMVAMEAFLSTDLFGFMRDIVPSLVNEFHNFTARFAPDAPAIPLTSAQADFVKEINKHSYLDLVPLTAFVPEGLETTYLEYSDRLDVAVDHADRILTEVLGPYTVFLSQLISNKEQKLSTLSMESFYKKLEEGRKNANLALGGCFGKGSTRTEVKYGDVIRRNNDWPTVFHNVEHLSKEMNRVDRKLLTKKVTECDHLLSIIIEKIKREEFVDVSPQVVQNIADGAYQIAAELEFFSVTYYKTLAFVEAINRSMQHVRQVFAH